MKYCDNCDQHVEPDGRINWIILIILLIFAFFPGLIYLMYCLIVKDKSCPQCGAANWGEPEAEEEEEEEE